MKNDESTETIIGCAYKVYSTMGYGYLKSLYENCVAKTHYAPIFFCPSIFLPQKTLKFHPIRTPPRNLQNISLTQKKTYESNFVA